MIPLWNSPQSLKRWNRSRPRVPPHDKPSPPAPSSSQWTLWCALSWADWDQLWMHQSQVRLPQAKAWLRAAWHCSQQFLIELPTAIARPPKIEPYGIVPVVSPRTLHTKSQSSHRCHVHLSRKRPLLYPPKSMKRANALDSEMKKMNPEKWPEYICCHNTLHHRVQQSPLTECQKWRAPPNPLGVYDVNVHSNFELLRATYSQSEGHLRCTLLNFEHGQRAEL